MFRTRILVQNKVVRTFDKKDGTKGTAVTIIATVYEDEESTIDLDCFEKTAEKLEIGKTYDIGLRIKGNEWNGKNYAKLTIAFADEVRSMKKTDQGETYTQNNESEFASEIPSKPAAVPFNDDDKDDLPF